MESKIRKNQKRYRLHCLVRKEGYRVDARKRTIYIPYTQTELSKNANKLRLEFYYGVQTEIV